MSLFEENEKIASAVEQAIQHYDYKNIQTEEKESSKTNQVFERIDLNSVNTIQNRQLGSELVGHTFWQRLNFKDILKNCGFSPYHVSLVEAVIVGRLVNPSNDLDTWKWLRTRSTLLELTDEAISNVGLLARCAQASIEKELQRKGYFVLVPRYLVWVYN